MVGAGHQAGFQLRAAARVRTFEKVIAWNLHPDMLPKLGEIAAELGLPFEAVPLERMVEADVIITITSSPAASLMSAHVADGTHLACMGTDTKGKQEVEPAILGRASVFADEVAQSVTIGEAQHAVAAGLVDASAITPDWRRADRPASGAAVGGGDHAVRRHRRRVAGPCGGGGRGAAGARAGAGDRGRGLSGPKSLRKDFDKFLTQEIWGPADCDGHKNPR
jgi:hypothetical protein